MSSRKRKAPNRPRGGSGGSGRAAAPSKSRRTRQWVLVGLTLLCVVGMVAPGLLFATGTNSSRSTPTSTIPEGSTSTTVAAQSYSCTGVAEGRPVPTDFAGCVGADGAALPATFLGCPDGANVIATAGFVGRPGGTWRSAPANATNEQLVAAAC